MPKETGTLSQLLAKWKFMLNSYEHMAKRDYGDDSPEQNKIVLAMGAQLARCIDDLELVMHKDPIRMALAKSINNSNGE